MVLGSALELRVLLVVASSRTGWGGLELSLDAVYADEVMADAVQHGEAGCPSPVLKGGPSQLVQHGRYT